MTVGPDSTNSAGPHELYTDDLALGYEREVTEGYGEFRGSHNVEETRAQVLEMLINRVRPHVDRRTSREYNERAFMEHIEQAECNFRMGVKGQDVMVPPNGKPRTVPRDTDRVLLSGEKLVHRSKLEMAMLLRLGGWNRPAGDEGSLNIALTAAGASPLTYHIREYLREENPFTVILPFAEEPNSAHVNVEYAIQIVGPENVVAADAQYCKKSAENVAGALQAGSLHIKQRQVLACIDWQYLSALFKIPVAEMEIGGGERAILPRDASKGLTVLAGVIGAHARGKIEGKLVVLEDTDVANPYDYDPLTYLAMPLACSDDNKFKKFIYIARTGPGRNNEGFTEHAARLAFSPDKEDLHPDVLPYFEARTMGSIGRRISMLNCVPAWPLTGERAIQGEYLLDMPFPTGMSLETVINIYASGRQLSEGKHLFHQVFNPSPKKEEVPNVHSRERRILARCEDTLDYLTVFLDRAGALLHEISPQQIIHFNHFFSQVYMIGVGQQDRLNTNMPTDSPRERLIPSINALMTMTNDGKPVLDMDRVRALVSDA